MKTPWFLTKVLLFFLQRNFKMSAQIDGLNAQLALTISAMQAATNSLAQAMAAKAIAEGAAKAAQDALASANAQLDSVTQQLKAATDKLNAASVTPAAPAAPPV